MSKLFFPVRVSLAAVLTGMIQVLETVRAFTAPAEEPDTGLLTDYWEPKSEWDAGYVAYKLPNVTEAANAEYELNLSDPLDPAVIRVKHMEEYHSALNERDAARKELRQAKADHYRIVRDMERKHESELLMLLPLAQGVEYVTEDQGRGQQRLVRWGLIPETAECSLRHAYDPYA